MKYIGSVDNIRLAQAFVDYANTIQLNCSYEYDEDNATYIIQLADVEKLELADSIFEEFSLDPTNDKYWMSSWHSNKTSDSLTNYWYAGRSRFSLSSILDISGIITSTVALACVFLFVIESYFSQSFINNLFIVNKGETLNLSEPWRLITPSFLHFDFYQLIINITIWVIFAGQIERKHSSWKLLNLFLVSAIISNLVQFNTMEYFGGIAGVVYAVIAYSWLSGKITPSGNLNLDNSLFIFYLVWLVCCYFGIFGLQNTTPMLISGLITGLLMALVQKEDIKKPL
ncbi:rhomboid family intramembrane serine protease [Psychrobium sp. MM17-31]|uniref:rhomboid family intramembrane serine protease n=1 Tax=Psychrobium sp. MM17-31 TaxID=2917758 RepID=UPI001EF625A9|nr:rhomboid family intramembrane serine protease [Psychrobium sp. MM17-31]MCG7532470.1 rhomboid family intramembrane serine protease [Psychrobium sp. MM17-31]